MILWWYENNINIIWYLDDSINNLIVLELKIIW